MPQAKVYVTQQPMKFDHDLQKMVNAADLAPAEGHGQLVFMCPPYDLPQDPNELTRQLEEHLTAYNPYAGDCLLLVGDPRLIAISSALAALSGDGFLRLLHWRGKERRYSIVEARVWESDSDKADALQLVRTST